jgi:hypothetical protein
MNDSLRVRSAEDNLALSILPRRQVKKREGQIDGSLYVESKSRSDDGHRRKDNAFHSASALLTADAGAPQSVIAAAIA